MSVAGVEGSRGVGEAADPLVGLQDRDQFVIGQGAPVDARGLVESGFSLREEVEDFGHENTLTQGTDIRNMPVRSGLQVFFVAVVEERMTSINDQERASGCWPVPPSVGIPNNEPWFDFPTAGGSS